ncbi:MAG: Mu transposase C-terminal domain-containing protein [Clostridia bacterium]|nr:Mu transposase C-terminal domain-containing protein [Clostridia bacterium]
MKFRELKVNSKVEYYEKLCTVWRVNPPYIELKKESDGEIITINFFELATNPSFKPASSFVSKTDPRERIYKSNLDELNEKNKEKVLERFELIRPIIVLRKAKENDLRSVYEFSQMYSEYFANDSEDIYKLTQKVLIERIAKKHQVGVRTINRYIADYYESESEVKGQGLEGLISKSGIGYTSRKDNKKLTICHPRDPELVLDEIDIRISEEYIPILKHVIEKEYLTLKKISSTSTYRIIKALCIKEGLEPPNKDTIYKLLKRIDVQVKVKLREGKKALEKYIPVNRGFSNEEAYYPLHIVEIDHTELDLDVIDENSGYNIGRPWITLGIDVYSRWIWCMYISLEPPSANRVRKAIEHGVLFKRAKERYNTHNEWPVCGKPNTIYVDNGPDFKSTNLKRMVTETLNANVMYRPVKRPNYGATIERLFGKINAELIHSLDGTRKSHFYELGDYDPEKEANLTVSDLNEILTQYFTDIYPFRTHRGLPIEENTPAVRFYEGLKAVGVPDFITPGEEEELFKIELLPTVMKPYTRDGIRLENVIYMDNRLSKYIANRDIKYKVKYDVDDISKVYFLVPDTNEYIEIPAVKPQAESIKGMNRYTYEKIRKILIEEAQEKLRQIPGASDVEKCQIKLQETVLKKYRTNKTKRKQAKLMNMNLEDMFSQKGKSNSKVSLKMLLEDAIKAESNRQEGTDE